MKIALIGTGGMGVNHLKVYPFIKGLELVAIADSNIECAKMYAEEVNCHVYESIEELLDKETVDAVDICVPSYLHSKYTIECLERGLHVFCEKPMSHSVEEADRMIEAANRNGVKLMIGQILRYWPEYLYLKACIDDERYGALTYLSFSRYYGMHPKGSWYHDQNLCKMVCYEMHIHDTDIVNYLFGLPNALHSVGCERPSIHMSYINTHYIYNNRNFAVAAQAGWNDSTFPFSAGYHAVFERGVVEYKDNLVMCYASNMPPEIAVLEKKTDLPADLEAVYIELREFIDLIEGRIASPLVTPESARNTIYIIGKESESLASASMITL